MRKPIPTRVHSLLDFMTAGLLVTLPRALGWGTCATRLLDASAASTVAYSVFTRYEMGAVKALPMKAHLALDAIQGGVLLGAAALMEDEDPDVRATLAALGVFEFSVTLLSQTSSPADAHAAAARPPRLPQLSTPQTLDADVGDFAAEHHRGPMFAM
jgi:hypothetical protein